MKNFKGEIVPFGREGFTYIKKQDIFPEDIIIEIFSYLYWDDIFAFCSTCKYYRYKFKHNKRYSKIFFERFYFHYECKPEKFYDNLINAFTFFGKEMIEPEDIDAKKLDDPLYIIKMIHNDIKVGCQTCNRLIDKRYAHEFYYNEKDYDGSIESIYDYFCRDCMRKSLYCFVKKYKEYPVLRWHGLALLNVKIEDLTKEECDYIETVDIKRFYSCYYDPSYDYDFDYFRKIYDEEKKEWIVFNK